MSEERPDNDSFVALFSRLVGDAEVFVRAELRLYRANIASRLAQARTGIILLLASFFLAQSAVVALLVGLVVALSRPLGAIGATGVVVGVAILVAGVCAWFGIGQIRAATDMKDDPQ